MPGVRDEVTQQQGLDRNWGAYAATLEARIHAVNDARRAFAGQEVGGVWAYRQALIDLASACELLADQLPQPRIAPTQAAVRPRD